DLFASVEPILPVLREDDVAVWVLGSGPYPPGAVALQELLDEASEELEPEDVWQPQDMNDTCLYIFTSGTTGLPKAARVSHLKSIMCLSFYELVGASGRDVVYLALPLYHMAGSLLGIAGCIGIGERGRAPPGEPRDVLRRGRTAHPPCPFPDPPFFAGATCVLKEKFSASQFWEDCRAEGVTGGESEARRSLRGTHPPNPIPFSVSRQRPGEREHGLRLAVGSGLRPDVWRRFLQRFGAVRV
ncbi:S27A3 protein, partial [Baryphthengus martii]|nr:S27A3 protein [Baryphthengus martii]